MSHPDFNWKEFTRKCPRCEKVFYVADPDIWVYKLLNERTWRGVLYCSWHCLQAARENVKKKKKRLDRKTVLQYDLDGNLVGTYEGINGALDHFDGYDTSLSAACRGVLHVKDGASDGHYYKGYRWFYKEQTNSQNKNIEGKEKDIHAENEKKE